MYIPYTGSSSTPLHTILWAIRHDTIIQGIAVLNHTVYASMPQGVVVYPCIPYYGLLPVIPLSMVLQYPATHHIHYISYVLQYITSYAMIPYTDNMGCMDILVVLDACHDI